MIMNLVSIWGDKNAEIREMACEQMEKIGESVGYEYVNKILMSYINNESVFIK